MAGGVTAKTLTPIRGTRGPTASCCCRCCRYSRRRCAAESSLAPVAVESRCTTTLRPTVRSRMRPVRWMDCRSWPRHQTTDTGMRHRMAAARSTTPTRRRRPRLRRSAEVSVPRWGRGRYSAATAGCWHRPSTPPSEYDYRTGGQRRATASARRPTVAAGQQPGDHCPDHTSTGLDRAPDAPARPQPSLPGCWGSTAADAGPSGERHRRFPGRQHHRAPTTPWISALQGPRSVAGTLDRDVAALAAVTCRTWAGGRGSEQPSQCRRPVVDAACLHEARSTGRQSNTPAASGAHSRCVVYHKYTRMRTHTEITRRSQHSQQRKHPRQQCFCDL